MSWLGVDVEGLPEFPTLSEDAASRPRGASRHGSWRRRAGPWLREVAPTESA